MNTDFYAFEDYSQEIDYKNHKWKDCTNTVMICEDSLRRTLEIIQNRSFAILTAYRAKFNKEENILRNRKLRAFLNQNRMGVHQLVGHYREDQRDGTFKDSIERSYLVEKPDDMTDKDFCDIVIGCLTIDGETQDTALIRFESKGNDIYLVDINGKLMKIGSKLNFNKDAIKLSNAYSQHVKKMDVPFMFDGEEVPQSNMGKMLYEKEGYVFSSVLKKR